MNELEEHDEAPPTPEWPEIFLQIGVFLCLLFSFLMQPLWFLGTFVSLCYVVIAYLFFTDEIKMPGSWYLQLTSGFFIWLVSPLIVAVALAAALIQSQFRE